MRPPTGGFPRYVVKAMTVDSATMKIPIIRFVRYAADGLVLSVTDAGNAVADAVLDQLELMIEVSRYTTGATA
jgi:hypothetical protein